MLLWEFERFHSASQPEEPTSDEIAEYLSIDHHDEIF